jgi:hypothetical protein
MNHIENIYRYEYETFIYILINNINNNILSKFL